jgi:hypothetical protein
MFLKIGMSFPDWALTFNCLATLMEASSIPLSILGIGFGTIEAYLRQILVERIGICMLQQVWGQWISLSDGELTVSLLY